jgi:hypothetical protein
MPITHDDITELKRVFDDRYVLQSDCNEKQEEVNKKFANDDKRIDLMIVEQKQMRKETKSGLKFNNWLTAAVLGVIVAGIVTFLFFNFGG